MSFVKAARAGHGSPFRHWARTHQSPQWLVHSIDFSIVCLFFSAFFLLFRTHQRSATVVGGPHGQVIFAFWKFYFFPFLGKKV